MANKDKATEVVNKQETEKEVNKQDIKPEVKANKEDTAPATDEINKAEKDSLAKLEQERAELAKAQETVNSLIGTLKEHVDKADNAEMLKVAAKYEILGHKPEELAKQLKSLKAFPEMYDTVIKTFDGALAAVEKSKAFEEVGRSGYSKAAVTVEKLAAEIQKADTKLSWRQAIDRAYQQRPELQGL